MSGSPSVKASMIFLSAGFRAILVLRRVRDHVVRSIEMERVNFSVEAHVARPCFVVEVSGKLLGVHGFFEATDAVDELVCAIIVVHLFDALDPLLKLLGFLLVV